MEWGTTNTTDVCPGSVETNRFVGPNEHEFDSKGLTTQIRSFMNHTGGWMDGTNGWASGGMLLWGVIGVLVVVLLVVLINKVSKN